MKRLTSRICTPLGWLLTLILISGCKQRHSSQKICMKALPCPSIGKPNITTSSRVLSLDEAVAIALEQNKELRAKFQTLGIAQADLEQAGMYTNPSITSIFRFPVSNDLLPIRENTEIDLDASFQLADLWQVPLRKKISQHDLHITSKEITNTIITTRFKVQSAYLQHVMYAKQVRVLKEMVQLAKELRNTVYERREYGYSTDLDAYLMDVAVEKTHQELFLQRQHAKRAFIELQKELGILLCPSQEFTPKPVEMPKQHSFPLPELEAHARYNHPLLLISKFKQSKQKKVIDYEHARIFPRLNVGISYERDLEGRGGLGPSIGFELPLFNRNQAMIRKARETLELAEKEYDAILYELIAHTRGLYQMIERYYDLLKSQNLIVESLTQGLCFAQKYGKQKQISRPIIKELIIELSREKVKAISLYYETLQLLAELELVTTRSILT